MKMKSFIIAVIALCSLVERAPADLLLGRDRCYFPEGCDKTGMDSSCPEVYNKKGFDFFYPEKCCQGPNFTSPMFIEPGEYKYGLDNRNNEFRAILCGVAYKAARCYLQNSKAKFPKADLITKDKWNCIKNVTLCTDKQPRFELHDLLNEMYMNRQYWDARKTIEEPLPTDICPKNN